VLTGEPLREPIALGGPIVMNTERELQEAYAELRAGTFIKGRTMPGGRIS
jgi:redox-sensitive bicupin YhaK (pirin superfamily)